ncbi:MAG: hypothetical protein LBP55_08515 [Candidatus Adiutrix sp.]|jgi:hypothetical protein|nr:hypothetical protein [Candidatus Adiutrix sp.]
MRGGIPQGFFYLTDFEGATARIHFALYAAGRPARLALGRQVLAWCWATFELQALLGVIPGLNLGAVNYARALGGRELGRLPGYCWVARLKRAVAGRQFLFEREAA